MTLFETVI